MKYKAILIATICITFILSTNAQTDYKSWAEEAIAPNIERAQREVDNYNSQNDLRLVSEAAHPWLFRAVSPWARNQYYTEKGMGVKPYLDPVLDKLAKAAASKLPSYVPGPTNFSYHNVNEEKMIRSRVQAWAPHNQIFKVGLVNSAWRIEKNAYGLPTRRYKWGKAWIRVTNSDHPYCWLVSINIIQDYSGGGTYAASYANQVDEELVGCPATK